MDEDLWDVFSQSIEPFNMSWRIFDGFLKQKFIRVEFFLKLVIIGLDWA